MELAVNRTVQLSRLHLLVALAFLCGVAAGAEGRYVRWITPGEKQAADFSVAPDVSVKYTGQPLSIAVTQ